MFTADDARRGDNNELDRRIREAVQEGEYGTGSLRVYIEDPWCRTIKEELEKRGFTNVQVPDIHIKGDVYFEWREE